MNREKKRNDRVKTIAADVETIMNGLDGSSAEWEAARSAYLHVDVPDDRLEEVAGILMDRLELPVAQLILQELGESRNFSDELLLKIYFTLDEPYREGIRLRPDLPPDFPTGRSHRERHH